MSRFNFRVAACVVALLFPTVGKADLVCPTGSLGGLMTGPVWAQYRIAADAYLKSLHARLSKNLGKVASVRGNAAKVKAAAEAGEFHAIVMRRMFEQGFIAATDILNAYCVAKPNREPWSEAIKREREQAWCQEWPDAHFCVG